MSKLSLQSQTIEKKKLYDMLYDEVLDINEENIQGKFYVDTNEELDKAALNYLMDNSIIEDEDDANFKLKWSGKGLYCFWGLGFGSDYSVAHIEEIFKAETDVDPLVFLGDFEKIETERQKFYQDASYVYVVWNFKTIAEIVEVDQPLDEVGVFNYLGPSGHKCHDDGVWWNHSVEEIRDMDNKAFYNFLKEYNKRLNYL